MKKEIKLQKENTKNKSKEPEKELRNEKEYLQGKEHITSKTKSRKNLSQLDDKKYLHFCAVYSIINLYRYKSAEQAFGAGVYLNIFTLGGNI